MARALVRAPAAVAQRPCAVSCEEALALFTELSDAVFPLFARVLDGRPPVLKVRQMKTRWGVCAPARRQITLNLRLAEKPRAAAEYVVLHEYAHFVHPNHSPAFWAVVARYMPDYKAARCRNRLRPQNRKITQNAGRAKLRTMQAYKNAQNAGRWFSTPKICDILFYICFLSLEPMRGARPRFGSFPQWIFPRQFFSKRIFPRQFSRKEAAYG